MKTRPDNNVIDRKSVIYAKNKIELSWPIRSSMIYDENWIGQRCHK